MPSSPPVGIDPLSFWAAIAFVSLKGVSASGALEIDSEDNPMNVADHASIASIRGPSADAESRDCVTVEIP